jgi:hypothetical protein
MRNSLYAYGKFKSRVGSAPFWYNQNKYCSQSYASGIYDRDQCAQNGVIILGFIGSIPMAMPMVTDNWYIAMGTLFMGIIYGFVIEVITTLLFKAKSVGRL